MFKFFVRCVFFIVGVASILEAWLPLRTEWLRVDQHTSKTQVSNPTSRPAAGSLSDTQYTLHLIGGTLASCSVGYSAYGQLKDGDSVEVQSSRIFRLCTRITRGEAPIYSYQYWKWYVWTVGAICIAFAIGWLKSDDDDSGGFSFRF